MEAVVMIVCALGVCVALYYICLFALCGIAWVMCYVFDFFRTLSESGRMEIKSGIIRKFLNWWNKPIFWKEQPIMANFVVTWTNSTPQGWVWTKMIAFASFLLWVAYAIWAWLPVVIFLLLTVALVGWAIVKWIESISWHKVLEIFACVLVCTVAWIAVRELGVLFLKMLIIPILKRVF